MNAHYTVPGAQDLTVAELCVEVGMDGLIFDPNPGPSLHDRWPVEATRLARRHVTDVVHIRRTATALEVYVTGTLCRQTARFALQLAMRASHLTHRRAHSTVLAS